MRLHSQTQPKKETRLFHLHEILSNRWNLRVVLEEFDESFFKFIFRDVTWDMINAEDVNTVFGGDAGLALEVLVNVREKCRGLGLQAEVLGALHSLLDLWVGQNLTNDSI